MIHPSIAGDIAPRAAVDVAPPSALDEPLVLFGIVVFGFAVVMLVWVRRRRATSGE